MSSEKVPRSLKEHIQRDTRSFKELKGKSRLNFIWDYYKLPIALLLVFILVAGIAAHILWEGQKPYRLRICVVLNEEGSCQSWFDRFKEDLISDGKSGDIDLNEDQPFDYSNQYYYIQEMEVMTTISSYRMDFAICNEDLYDYLLALNACLPLDQNLPADFYEELSAKGLIDHNIANLQIDENGQTHPEEGIEGDYAVRLNGSKFAREYNRPKEGSEKPLYAVIIANTDHLEDCVTLMKALSK